jgi:hypothetical protein
MGELGALCCGMGLLQLLVTEPRSMALATAAALCAAFICFTCGGRQASSNACQLVELVVVARPSHTPQPLLWPLHA